MDWQIYGMEGFGGNATVGSGNAAMGTEVFFLIAIIIVLLQLRTRKVRPVTIWIPPVFIALVTLPVIASEYSGIGTLLLSVAGFVIGCAAGVVIGSRMEVRTDESGRIVLKGSVIAVLIWVLVLGLKIFGKGFIGDTGLISLADLTAAMLAMTLGTIIARRAYIIIKYLSLKKAGTTETKDTTAHS
jgi:membrane protein CcdC involved in cytochrome C biogenesis